MSMLQEDSFKLWSACRSVLEIIRKVIDEKNAPYLDGRRRWTGRRKGGGTIVLEIIEIW